MCIRDSNETDHDVDVLLVDHAVGVVEHVIRLANAGSRSDVDAKFGGFLFGFKLDFSHGSAHLDRMMHCFNRGNGQGEAEGGAVAKAALDCDLAAERFDETANESEAQARAALRERIKAIEDGSETFGFDATAGVAHGELDEVFDLFGSEEDLAILGRIAQGVGEQVVEDGAESATIGFDNRQIGVGFDLDADVLLSSLLTMAVATLSECLKGPCLLYTSRCV